MAPSLFAKADRTKLPIDLVRDLDCGVVGHVH
jgi:hypothetical protein